jgi:hypothetical protein
VPGQLVDATPSIHLSDGLCQSSPNDYSEV